MNVYYALETLALISVQTQLYYLYTRIKQQEKANKELVGHLINTLQLIELTNSRMERKARLPEDRPFESAAKQAKTYKLHIAGSTDGNHN
jgi:hypothetical protein